MKYFTMLRKKGTLLNTLVTLIIFGMPLLIVASLISVIRAMILHGVIIVVMGLWSRNGLTVFTLTHSGHFNFQTPRCLTLTLISLTTSLFS